MRNYRIDEMEEEQIERFRKFLDSKDMAGAMPDLYWLDIPEELYSEMQTEHAPTCGHYSVGIELGEDWIQAELLVRARSKLRCDCVAYATDVQRTFILDTVDTLLREQDISV